MITIVRDEKRQDEKKDASCNAALKTTVLEVKMENVENVLKEHKKNSEKHFDLLENKIDNKIDKLETTFKEEFKELKEIFQEYEEKLENVEEKVNQLKNSFTALVTKFGILFSFLCSLGVMGLNFVMDKFK